MSLVSTIILNLRPHPIRISNESAADGQKRYSGDCWDGAEITWEQVAERALYSWEEFQALYLPALTTSVTKKIRRVFEFPKKRFEWIWNQVGGPEGNVLISLNFVNWIDKKLHAETDVVKIHESELLREWIHENLPLISQRDALKIIRSGPRINQCVSW